MLKRLLPMFSSMSLMDSCLTLRSFIHLEFIFVYDVREWSNFILLCIARATLWPSNCTTGYLPKRYKCSDSKGHVHPNVYSGNVHNSQTMERAQMPIDRWMDKKDIVHTHTHKHTHNGILRGHQKWNLAICSDVDETRGFQMLSEMSQSEKVTIWSHWYVEFKKQCRRS